MNRLSNAFSLWWSGISQREKHLVVVFIILLIMGVFYWGMAKPMSERAQEARHNIVAEKQLLHWIKQKADRITQLRSSGGITASNQPIHQVVSASAKRYKIELTRIQPRDNLLQVDVKPVEFDQLVRWLAYLQTKQGVQVQFMNISASDTKGIVEVKRLQLKRGG